ncbi:hypothetical protein AWZ03_013386 [Drosophila navojoa]|uniref:C2H2-type domain-containing protein n=2 Tax=Drosophila navojoa TaxID=7232 RepID=A0A484AUZ1_DRONA|nr:hypothetical protein AWZ03_013386 [Drosophila navojoa]
MPIKSEYSEQNDGGGCDDDDVDADGNHYVVLDSVDVGRDFKNEEFLLVNDDGTGNQLLLDNAHLHQQLVNCADLLREPRDDQFENVQYMGEEQLPEDVDDLVEEDEEEVDGQLPVEEQLEQYEQYEDDVHIQDQQNFGWNYVQTPSPISESVAMKLESMTTTTTNTTTTKSTTTTTTALSPPPSRSKSKSSPHSSARSHVDHVAIDASFEEITHVADEQQVEEPAPLAKPSEKMLDQFKGPRRYMLFDELVATIVDFDEDGTPIVEFSMIGSALDEKLPVECGICPDVMHKSKLSKHQKTHMVPGTNRYACIYCTETYRDCKYLAGHARRHMGIRPYVCEPCKLYFSTKQDLHVHNQRRHLKKEHICEMCGKTFAQNTQLKRHREATHEKKRRFQCEHCQKAYYKNFSLQEHIRNVHMGKRRMLKCPFCGMQCRDAHKMARHRKEMHLNQDTYVCHLCQEEFTDINYFDAHKRSIQCRSNTRRLVNQAEGRTSNEDGDTMDDCNELAGMLEEEYDEDAGLLVESTEASVVDGVDGIIGEAVADEDQPRDDEPIYETVNGNFLHAEVEDQPYAQQYDPSSYDDDGLLVEQVADDEDHSEQILNDDEEYLDPALDHQTQQQHQQQAGHEYNEDELIYEITLETEDN